MAARPPCGSVAEPSCPAHGLSTNSSLIGGQRIMSKAKAKAKQVKGKMKETTGKAMDDEGMQVEGRGEQIVGKTQETADKAAGRVKRTGR
ncbi:CsbD family protein [Streptomyces sp. GbtcB7]|uniref:CsbD family protein n=1 Tax=Streptomyces sp. GbtcB7 TaxID=2824752 RepID=UPI0027E45C76|nr:CsbD family protein [Streptomyces sp. GbtcB7]